jgi:hypothetical protein
MPIPLNRSGIRNLFALALFLSSIATGVADNYNRPPSLFTVSVPTTPTGPGEFDIPIKFGAGKTRPIALSDTWRVHGGTDFEQQPPSRHPVMVELHGTVGKIRKLIARVMVRYYRNETGRWQPLYLLNQEPLMVPTPEGWQPLFDTRESPEILGLLNRDLPNPAGYRPSIDFKVQRGKVSIDSWVVKEYQ